MYYKKWWEKYLLLPDLRELNCALVGKEIGKGMVWGLVLGLVTLQQIKGDLKLAVPSWEDSRIIIKTVLVCKWE